MSLPAASLGVRHSHAPLVALAGLLVSCCTMNTAHALLMPLASHWSERHTALVSVLFCYKHGTAYIMRHTLCYSCRSDADFTLLTRCIVDVETNSLFVPFHRPDLNLTPAAAAAATALLPPDKNIKSVDYGRPAHAQGAYRAPEFKACAEDRTLPAPTIMMVITESKPSAKTCIRSR